MSLRLILGDTNSGKSNKLVEEMTNKAKAIQEEKGLLSLDTKIFAIVPEQATLKMQQSVVKAAQNGAVMNIDVVSFERLAYVVFDELGTSAANVLDDTGKALILRKILNEAKEDLVVYKSKTHMPGFVSEIKSIVTELKQYGIDDNTLFLMQEKAKEENNNLLFNKLKDIRLIYEKFNEEIANKFTTAEEVLDIFAKVAPYSEKIKNSYIYLDGFTGFTPIQNKLIEKFLQVAKDVTIAITLPKDKICAQCAEHELFYLSNQTYFKLIEMASKYPDKLDCIYTNKQKNINEKGYIYEATSQKDEVLFVAKEVLKLVRDEGYRYKDIAVITSDLEGYYSQIKDTFEQANISCFIDYKNQIINNLLSRYTMAALELANSRFSYDFVFGLLKSGFCDMSFEEIAQLENYCLEFGIKGSKAWSDEFKKNKKIYGKDEYFWDLEQINSYRKKVYESVSKFYSAIQKSKYAKDFSDALIGLYEKNNVKEKIDAYCDEFNQEGLLSLAKEYEQIYELVINLLEKTSLLLGTEEITLKNYMSIIEEGIKEIKIGIIPPSLDALVVGDLTRTRLDDIKVLFLIGANDGKIPKVSDSSGIFTEKERIFLKKDFEIAPSVLEDLYIQKFYLYMLLNKHSDKLYISYASMNADGAEIAPSYLLSDLDELTSNLKFEKAFKADIMWPAFALNELAASIRNNADAGILKYFANEEPYKLKQIIDGALYTNKQTPLDSQVALDLYGDVLYGSVSRYEKFNECPFKHFMLYGLKVNKRPEYKIEASDVGTIYHDALEKYSKTLEEKGLSFRTISDEQSHEIIGQCVLEALDNINTDVLDSAARNEFLKERINIVATKTTDVLREHVKKGEFEPELFEYNFVCDLSSDVKFNGKIDRVDIYDADDVFVKIIDYKTGEKQFKTSDIYLGLQLQLVAYMKQVLDNISKNTDKKVRPGGIYYYKINDKFENSEEEASKKYKMSGLTSLEEGVISAIDSTLENGMSSNIIDVGYKKEGELKAGSNVANEKEFLSLMDYVDKMILNVSEEIKKGNINIEPSYKDERENACRFCDYLDVCKFQAGSFGCDWKENSNLTNAQMEDVLYGRSSV